jgi:AcrR family transcriptional regulator
VARTLDPEAHAIRRDVFLDAAQGLIQAKGYERVSIQDLLDATGASKGAFYHYFESKTALLDAIIDRLVETGVARYGPIAADPTKTARQKFEAFFTGLADYKAEQRELILATVETWLSEENAIVREHFRRNLVGRLQPLLLEIVRQGVDEGDFSVTSPEATARVLVSMIQGMNEDATGLFLALDAGTLPFELLEIRLTAYVEAFERILGVPKGSLRFADPSVIRDWQRWSADYRKDHP